MRADERCPARDGAPHASKALIATQACVVTAPGRGFVADIEWCADCGAFHALTKTGETRWLLPGAPRTREAFAQLQERIAEHEREVPHA